MEFRLYGKEESVKETHQGFLSRSIPARILYERGERPDVIVIDPPRKGCDAAVITTIAAMRPTRVVYVSCDPATLARDLKQFTAEDYNIEAVTPVDMFPGTAHVETVVLLSHKKPDGHGEGLAINESNLEDTDKSRMKKA